MKKKIIICLLVVLFTLTGCKLSFGRTYENLLKDYTNAYSKGDLKTIQKIFPPYYVEFSKDIVTQEYLDKQVNTLKSTFGDDFKITYEITGKTKLTNDELKTLNEKMAKYYNAKDNATECYKYEGDLIIKGSKNESKSSLSSIGYCKYKNTWYIVAISI